MKKILLLLIGVCFALGMSYAQNVTTKKQSITNGNDSQNQQEKTILKPEIKQTVAKQDSFKNKIPVSTIQKKEKKEPNPVNSVKLNKAKEEPKTK